MSDVFRTLIVPADLASLARALAAGLSTGGANMFLVPLSPTGAEPATHYVSTGYIAERFAEAIASADLLLAACQAAEPPAPVTLEQCTALIDGSDVSEEPPFDVFARLGLMLVAADLQ